MDKIHLGIIREQKTPPDNRTPLTPQQCQLLQQTFPQLKITVQPSPHRCFTDEEYAQTGIEVSEYLNHCHILLGVKEPPPPTLLSHKTYLFFSHTIKKQPQNRGLLQTVLQKNIQLIDYECLRYTNGKRIIGFGRFAGIVGAHNGLMAYGNRTGLFTLPPAYRCKDFEEIKQIYSHLSLPPIRIVLTGAGRVAMGAKETLDLLKVKHLTPQEYLEHHTWNEPVYVHLQNHQLYRHKERHDYERHDFYRHPERYYCHFEPFTRLTDLMINGIYWDPQAPLFFTKTEMKNPHFSIKVIADITCDINGSIPATLRATEIGNPVMGYNPQTEQEDQPYQPHTIDIMSIDNLPNELPRDASDTFGSLLCEHVIPQLLMPHSSIIEHATITQNGSLTTHFNYLHDYVS
ncbi:MAG TPA: NAD(P)-dependent oxidoreductase [Chitinophagales bacterium]|nr:NAD(P)-dependent oxidoreductase [Chitinophagales bacterium]